MKKFGTAVILAGGQSRRMGFDKQLIKINERRLMDSVINKLRLEFDQIIIVTNKPEYYIGLSDMIVSDIIKGMGPLSGIHVGLKNASSQLVYFIACDMPNINLDYIKYIRDKLKDSNCNACVTRFGEWIEPFNAFYSTDMIRDIEYYLLQNRRSVFKLLETLEVHYISENEARDFSPNWDMFLNLNTKEDLNYYLQNISATY